MCHQSVLGFTLAKVGDVSDKRVLEVGSYDVNGSPRRTILEQNPGEYIGVDMNAGPGVDQVVNATELVAVFGKDSFDIVICNEMLEHAEDWRSCINNMKQVCRDKLIITTRSKGFPYHGYPHDYWRYSLENMRKIFADFDIEVLEGDPEQPGVMMVAYKTKRKPVDLSQIELEGV